MKLKMKKPQKNSSALQDSTDKVATVQSVRRAADILKCIGEGVNSVSGIAANCNLNKSTVHRLLKALSYSDLVIQNPISHQYFPGYQLVKLSMSPTTYKYLIDCAIDDIQHLCRLTGETVDLRIKLGLQNFGLDLAQSKNDLIVVGESLRNRPINIGVDGRVLLSQLDDEELALILEYITIKRRENINKDDFMAEINLIRQQGYAVSSDELIKGVTCISAPVKNSLVPAALSIVGPDIRIRPRIKDLIKELLVYATRISRYISDYQNKIIGLDRSGIIRKHKETLDFTS